MNGAGNINGPNVDPAVSWAQTFTAGLTGGLDRVDLSLVQNKLPGEVPNSVGLTVEIRTVSAGVPGGGVLASATIAPDEIPSIAWRLAFVSIHFSPPAPVTTGVQYAIVAYTGGADMYLWGAAFPGPYAGGEAFISFA